MRRLAFWLGLAAIPTLAGLAAAYLATSYADVLDATAAAMLTALVGGSACASVYVATKTKTAGRRRHPATGQSSNRTPIVARPSARSNT